MCFFSRPYIDVLNNEAEIINTSTNKTVLLDDYREGDFANLAMEFTLVDLDKEGVPEVIVNFKGPDIRLMLHYENERIYGHIYGIKELKNIKRDGTFYWGYSTYFGWSRLIFLEGISKNIKLASFEYKGENNERIYTVNNNIVSEKEYYDFDTEQEKKENVVWYEFTDENVKRVLMPRSVNNISGILR